jgi:hypothetical protein
MINYIKTTNGYFYKICKNGKKRISEDEYNKRKKLKKMTGGMFPEDITIIPPNKREHVMENVFLTGDISPNGRTSTISRITKKFMDFLTHVKTNNNNIGKQRRIESNLQIDITYVGEIRYIGSRHSGIVGTCNIWVQRNYNSKKVRYIIEIITKNNRNKDTSNYEKNVYAALETLFSREEHFDLIINALSRIGVQLDGTRELIDEIKELYKKIKELDKKKSSLYMNMIHNIDWTFTFPRQ